MPPKCKPSPSREGPSFLARTSGFNSQAWPLTADNLSQLQDEFAAAGADTRLRSGSLSAASDNSHEMSTKFAMLEKLALSGIMVDRGTSPPESVQALVTQLRGTLRAVASPSASHMAGNAHMAREGHEEHSNRILGADLALAAHDEAGGHPWTDRHSNVQLSVNFLPSATDVMPAQHFEQARPAICNGYRKGLMTDGASVSFTTDEERCIATKEVRNPRTQNLFSMALLDLMLFPWFTVQCKQDRSLYKADMQGARDGATINEYLRSVFRTAQGSNSAAEPDPLNIAHFSASFDGYIICLWVHWYKADTQEYCMERIKFFRADEEDDILEYRQFLRNLEDHAMGDRLNDIKAALRTINAQPAAAPAAAPATATPAKRPRGRPKKVQPVPAPAPAPNSPPSLRRSGRFGKTVAE
ncbi:hypothetical protein P171DRAFT_485606 [Karstenula rhodostoma CBS 690.94]|uniref:DUF7924 domain-containing protein n=1 Tax=Karstenula rhodostoma CBS 690.94 TaxID=1392251 RepID=A0A9P4UCA4_9PLEO|nr:hypothetical protein P171DRAFT_485606 [Karstenula rhodostoma CBS 690.94]